MTLMRTGALAGGQARRSGVDACGPRSRGRRAGARTGWAAREGCLASMTLDGCEHSPARRDASPETRARPPVGRRVGRHRQSGGPGPRRSRPRTRPGDGIRVNPSRSRRDCRWATFQGCRDPSRPSSIRVVPHRSESSLIDPSRPSSIRVTPHRSESPLIARLAAYRPVQSALQSCSAGAAPWLCSRCAGAARQAPEPLGAAAAEPRRRYVRHTL